MGRTVIAGGIAVVALSLSAACEGRLFGLVYEGADAGALDSLDGGIDTGSSLMATSNLKCRRLRGRVLLRLGRARPGRRAVRLFGRQRVLGDSVRDRAIPAVRVGQRVRRRGLRG